MKHPIVYDPHSDVLNMDGTLTKPVCADCGGFCKRKAGGLNGYYCVDSCDGSKARNHWASVTLQRYRIPLLRSRISQ